MDKRERREPRIAVWSIVATEAEKTREYRRLVLIEGRGR